MVAFRAFPQFNSQPLQRFARVRARLDERAARLFPSRRLPDRLARELARRRVLSLKELLESFEFVERVRRRVRAPQLADLCCGHGLTGLLFAVFERRVEQVLLLDQREPPSWRNVWEATVEVAPWTAAKVTRVDAELHTAASHVMPGTTIVAVHACGQRTDRCIELAIDRGGALALMPCCYNHTSEPAPRAIRSALGAALATDVDRTYRLEAAGFAVAWSEVPVAITPMNRVLIADRRPPI